MHCRASMRGQLTLQQCGPQEGGRVCQAQSATSSASLIASARVAAPLNSLASSTISTRTLNSWREVEGGKQGHGRRAGSDRVRHGVSPVRGLPRQGRRTQRLARMLPLRCGLDGVAGVGVDGRQPASWRSAPWTPGSYCHQQIATANDWGSSLGGSGRPRPPCPHCHRTIPVATLKCDDCRWTPSR